MNGRSFTRILILFITSSLTSYAQQEIVDTTIFNKIRKAELESSQIPQIAHYLTDVSGPRLTNSPGYQKASRWAVETMKKWGLVNAALEPWGEFGKQWEIKDFSIALRLPYAQSVVAYPVPWSANTNGLQQAEVVLLSEAQAIDSTYLSQHLGELNGKFILVTGPPVDPSSNFEPSAKRYSDSLLANMKETYMVNREQIAQYIMYAKMLEKLDALLKKSGALGIIRAGSSDTNGTVHVQAESGYKVAGPLSLPKVSMSLDDGQKIKRLIQSGHKVEIALNINGASSTQDTKGYNVVAEIPGSDPQLKSQLVMLGGHLDSWQAATGATDNAAGCIVMMEAVRLLDSLNIKPKRTIRIALWSAEEQGLLGSYNYVKNHFINAETGALKPEQGRVSAYFNLDNGTGKIRGVYAQNNTAIKPIFEKWLEPFHDLGAKTVTLKNTGSTDHISFDWAGMPGFQFIQDPVDYLSRTHHTNMDDFDHLLIDDLKQAAIIVASFVYQASVRPDLLPRKPYVKETFVFEGF